MHEKGGVQIEALIQYVKLFQEGDATLDARKELLIGQREQLSRRIADMQESLALLNYKIQRYELGLMASRKPVVSSPESATMERIYTARTTVPWIRKGVMIMKLPIKPLIRSVLCIICKTPLFPTVPLPARRTENLS